MGPDLTQAYSWPALNKEPTHLWNKILLEIIQNQRWLTRPDLIIKKMTQPGSRIWTRTPANYDGLGIFPLCKKMLVYLIIFIYANQIQQEKRQRAHLHIANLTLPNESAGMLT